LVQDIHATPAPLHILVPTAPTICAATDASHLGMGRAWTLQTETSTHNCLWRTALPPELHHQLITSNNIDGFITINDLELAALILGATLATTVHSGFHHVLSGTDNTAACSWINKGSTTSLLAPAFLLHQLARLRRFQPFTLSAVYIPGLTNQVADCCSCLFSLSNDAFLAMMNTASPVQPSWKLVTPPTELLSLMNYALSNRLQPLASLQNDKIVPAHSGIFGLTSAKISDVIPNSPPSTIPYHYSRSSPIDTTLVPWLPVGLRSNLEQWRTPFEPWGRRSPH
jgi:hypothetical protein